jgi:hypothetical protein
MSNEIDLNKIFNQVWGFIGLPFPEIIIRSIPVKAKTPEVFEEFMSVQNKISISEKGVSYRMLNENGIDAFMPVWLSEIDNNALEYLLQNTIMSMSSRLSIVTTQLVNRDGTVKEQISMDEWSIRIRGVLIGEGDNYPETETQQLVNWYKKKKALCIQNVRTALCLEQLEKVIITNLDLKELNGYENTQPYELQLLSDVDFNLYLD